MQKVGNMKKILNFSLLSLLLLASPVFAKTVAVEAMSGFTTEDPPREMSVKLLEDIVLDDNTTLAADYVIDGKIVDVTDPKRLKRNATFTFVPVSYKDKNGKVSQIKAYCPAKYTTKINKGELAKSVGLGVGSFFVKGLSLGYSAVEGAIKNEQDNRFKSSVTNVYNDSPLSYVEKGEELVIEKEQVFFLNFKLKDDVEEDDAPNYEYQELPSETNVK